MKRRSYTLLFRLTSWLADRTGGWQPFVRWKLALGTLLVSLAASCGGQRGGRDTVTCYISISIPDSLSKDKMSTPMCYEPAVPVKRHNTAKPVKTESVLPDDTLVAPEMCYIGIQAELIPNRHITIPSDTDEVITIDSSQLQPQNPEQPQPADAGEK